VAADPTTARDRPTTVVFDLGGVLVHWDPRLLFAQLLDEDEDVEAFLEEIDFAEWNHAQDAGKPWADAVAEHSARHPHRAEALAAYPERFAESITGLMDDSVAVVEELRERGVRLLALTNWSAELFPLVRPRLRFLDDFEAVVVSGVEGLAKPDPALFRVLVERHAVVPEETVYVDDVQHNVDTATALGFRAHLFTDAPALRLFLVAQGLLPGAP
jgi:2-haloacid dehalogenase